jgi:MFS family permease
LCPKNIEGTLYAFLMSVINLGSLLSNQFGAILSYALGITNHNFSNLGWLIFLANIILLLPMPGLCLIDETVYVNKSKNEQKDEKDDKDEKIKFKTENFEYKLENDHKNLKESSNQLVCERNELISM